MSLSLKLVPKEFFENLVILLKNGKNFKQAGAELSQVQICLQLDAN